MKKSAKIGSLAAITLISKDVFQNYYDSVKSLESVETEDFLNHVMDRAGASS
jgi:hypothetical protein